MSILKKKQSDNHSFFKGLNPYIVLILFLLVLSGITYRLISTTYEHLFNLDWEVNIPDVGLGSPRLVDLNNDRILDVVISSGLNWSVTENATTLALNGRTGSLLWKTIIPYSSSATPILIDINNDSRTDITAISDLPDFYMLNGRNGTIIWQLSIENPNTQFLPYKFNNPILVPDQDGDGVRDIVVIQGSYAENSTFLTVEDEELNLPIISVFNQRSINKNIKNYLKQNLDEEFILKICKGNSCAIKSFHRSLFERASFDTFINAVDSSLSGPVSRVYIISSRSGKIIRFFNSPSNINSLMSPVFFINKNSDYLIYSTGDIYKAGQLIAQDLKTGQLIWSLNLDNDSVIAPPLFYASKNEAYIILASTNGNIFKVNAINGKLIWKKLVIDNHVSYSSPAVIKTNQGYNIVSVFINKEWEKHQSSKLFILNAQNGQIELRKEIGRCNITSSPLIADINNDNKEDILLLTCSNKSSQVLVLNHNYNDIFSFNLNSGSGATPILSDIDNDAHLDLIVPRFHYISRFKLVKENTSLIPLNWNQYRGKNWSGSRLNFNN